MSPDPKDRRLSSSSWDTKQILECRPPTGRSNNRKNILHHQPHRLEPSYPNGSNQSINSSSSSTKTFAEEICSLMNRGGPSMRTNCRFAIPPPTAYQNRSSPLRALPLPPLHPSSTGGSQGQLTTSNDTKKLCRFFANMSQSNCSLGIQNSTNHSQMQTTSASISSTHDNQGRSMLHRSQESHQYNNTESIRSANPVGLRSYNNSQAQLLEQPRPHQYLTYPQRNVSYTLIPNQQIAGSQCQKQMDQFHQNDSMFHHHHQHLNQNEPHCQQNNSVYKSQNDSIYYNSRPQQEMMYQQAPMAQQVNIQQAHLTLKTTQVATTLAGNFHNNPCTVEMYPSMDTLCNIWGQPPPNSPPSNLQYMNPAGFVVGNNTFCTPPRHHEMIQQLFDYNNNNQIINHGDPNVPRHTVVDLGAVSNTNLHQPSQPPPKMRNPWSLQNENNNNNNNESFNNNFQEGQGQHHNENRFMNQFENPVQKSDSSISLSTPSDLNFLEDSIKNDKNKKQAFPLKSFKCRTKSENFTPTVEDVLKEMEKDLHQKTLDEGLTLLSGQKWIENVLGMKIIILQSRADPERLTDQLSEVSQCVLLHLKSPKSKLCRQAISCFRELFLQLGPLMDSHLDQVSDKLLKKTTDTNKFIKDECESALEAMVRSCSAVRVISCLVNAGNKQKNVTVRRTVCRMIRLFIDYFGADISMEDFADKILPTLYAFMEEPTSEIREEAKKAIKMLIRVETFDEGVKRFVHSTLAARVKDRVERVRDEVLNRTPRRRRKKNVDKLFG